mgnify:FL=1
MSKHTATDKPKREHKMSESGGFGYETDGTNYWLPQSLMDSWGETEDQAAAQDAVLAAVTKAVVEARRLIEAQRRKWWERVYDHLGLDTATAYTCYRMERKLEPIPKEKK